MVRTRVLLCRSEGEGVFVCESSTDGAFLTHLDCVAVCGRADVVNALIKGGAAMDATDNIGRTALHDAALSPRAMWTGAGLARTRLTLIGAFLTLRAA